MKLDSHYLIVLTCKLHCMPHAAERQPQAINGLSHAINPA